MVTKSYEGIFMSINSPQINPNTAYYSPAADKKIKAGGTILGGLLGMTAYYIPVTRDEFVNRAFKITKDEANDQIVALTNAVKEIEKGSLSSENKMILQEMGVGEDIVDITRKCMDIDQKVSDPTSVRNLKTYFHDNFANFKKNPHLMDNNCASAFKKVKWTKFKWGVGIGAAVGLALGLLTSKD